MPLVTLVALLLALAPARLRAEDGQDCRKRTVTRDATAGTLVTCPGKPPEFIPLAAKPKPKPKAEALPKPEGGRFGMFAVPPKTGGEKDGSAVAKARDEAETINEEIAAAQKAAPKGGDAEAVKEVVLKHLPALNGIGSDPELPAEVREQIARYNNQAGRYQEALHLSEITLKSQPEHRDALHNSAGARYGLGDYKGAIADATRAAEVDPNSESAYSIRSLSHYAAGNYLQALEDSKRALALNPNDKTAFSVMKLSEGRIAPSVKLPAGKTAEGLEVEREYQGSVQLANQVEERRRAMTAGGTPDPGEKLLRSAAGKIAIKDYWGAVADAQRAVAQSPTAQGYYLLSAAHNLLGRNAEAARAATEALVLDPNDIAARDARAWAYYRMGRLSEAMADANKSLELGPRNAYAYANRSFIHERLGDFESMVADLRSAATLNPQFEPAHRDALARTNLQSAPLPDPSLRRDVRREAAQAERTRRKSFITIMTSSLIGGFLIALGLLHIMSSQWSKGAAAQTRAAAATPASGEGVLHLPSALRSAYRIGPVVGQGGMGVVYEAVDRALNRKVAIKMLRPELQTDPRDRARFLGEARTVAALRHPGIVEIYSIVEDDSGLYLVFEFIEGRSLEKLLSEKGRLSLAESKAVIKGVCRALEYAHRHGVVHRDLKPGNIMLTTHGQIKVMDFGIAKVAREARGKLTDTVVGTPYYMAPEQEAGVVRRESDIFALGACLYEMVTGQRPYPAPASTPLKLAKEYSAPSKLVPLPGELDGLIDAALEPDPDKRLGSATEFLARLERISDVSGPATPAPGIA